MSKRESRLDPCVLFRFTCAALAAAPVLADAQQPAATGERALEEIFVTANRREERLQDVGISVTALGSESLGNLNITTATDITRAVPSLKMNAYSSSQVVFNIRGVAQNSYGDEQEPPVAVYQDDSYSSSINLASFPVFDLERVETLRGPQGTLFGRNATGGAIQFISRKPSDEFEGYAAATFGRFNQQIFEGAVSGPFTDKLQGRIAFISNQDDGYINELVPGEEDRGANDHYALRGRIAWQPTDSTEVDLILRYLRADKERQAGLYSHEPACPNAQRQGEFTPPHGGLRVLGKPGRRGRHGLPQRRDHPESRRRSLGHRGDLAFLRRPHHPGGDAAHRFPDRRARLRLDHGLPERRQVLHRGRRRLARRGRRLLPGQ